MKVLIVEDTGTDALLLKWNLEKTLKALGHEEVIFDRAKNETEAISKICLADCDLITEDGNLENNGKGINVINSIHRHFHHKIIGISDDESFLSACKEKGIVTFHKKDMTKDSQQAKFTMMVKNILHAK